MINPTDGGAISNPTETGLIGVDTTSIRPTEGGGIGIEGGV